MSDNQTVVSYLTEEIRELIQLGPVHAFTWVANADPGRWMQVSIHDGDEHYLTVLCVLPPHIAKEEVDRALGKVGRRQSQVNHGTCLVYYLAQCENLAALFGQAAAAAEQCAAIARLLWNAQRVEDFGLLGARGPRLTLGDRRQRPIGGLHPPTVDPALEIPIEVPAPDQLGP